MKKLTLILTLLTATIVCSCVPDRDTKQERETVEADSVDNTQGKGEGEAGDEIGG